MCDLYDLNITTYFHIFKLQPTQFYIPRKQCKYTVIGFSREIDVFQFKVCVSKL